MQWPVPAPTDATDIAFDMSLLMFSLILHVVGFHNSSLPSPDQPPYPIPHTSISHGHGISPEKQHTRAKEPSGTSCSRVVERRESTAT